MMSSKDSPTLERIVRSTPGARIVRTSAESNAAGIWMGVIKARNGRGVATTDTYPSWQAANRAAEDLASHNGWDIRPR